MEPQLNREPVMDPGEAARRARSGETIAEIDAQLAKNRPAIAAISGALEPEPTTDNIGPRLAKLLRVVGCCLLLGAAVACTLQTWSVMSFISRYLTFLGFTGILAAAGVYCGLKMKEDKGARSFLGVAVAFLPAHFVQLSALLYNGLYGAPEGLRPFFVVVAPSLTQALIVLGVAVPVLTGITFLAFSALLRPEAKKATFIYLLANLALLIPTRDPNLVATISLGLIGMLAMYDIKCLRQRALMASTEGVICRTVLLLPYLALLERNFLLYNHTPWFHCCIVLAMTAMSLALSKSLEKIESHVGVFFQWIFERLTFVGTVATWALFVNSVLDVPAVASIPLTYLPISLAFFGLSFEVKGNGRGYRRLAAWIAVGSVLAQVTTEEGIISSCLCLVTSVGITAAAHAMRERGMFIAGVSGLVYGLLYHLKYAADFYAMSPWLSLAVIGTIVLLTSSYVERNFSRLVEMTQKARAELDGWA